MSNKGRTQQYVMQMYRCNMFNETQIRKWEYKDDAEKTWEEAKSYYENLFAEKQTFQDDMGMGKSGFESATNLGESRSQWLPSDGRRWHHHWQHTQPNW